MKYTERLLNNKVFLQTQRDVKEQEADRIYCHHELSHALDVARMAWIMYLENQMVARASAAQSDETVRGCFCPASQEEMDKMKDHFYVTGLLHDVGRSCQYATGEHHSIAGMRIAGQILEEIDYPEELQEEILHIVSEHTGREEKDLVENSLSYYIEKADHLSRNCFLCEARETCKWEAEELNTTIIY